MVLFFSVKIFSGILDVTIDITTAVCYNIVVTENVTTKFKTTDIREDTSMSEVVKFLEANPVQYLATVGRDGKAKCRPFMFCFEKDGKLWFNTNNQKDVYKDMQENPNIEICVSSPSYEWIRVSGRAVFVDDRAVKEAAIESPLVKSLYRTADNPMYEVFYLADAKATIADFSGNPPREYTL